MQVSGSCYFNFSEKSANHVRHRIQAGRLSSQKFSRLNGSLGKNCLGISGMSERDHLVCAGKNHVVLPYDCAAADRLNSDFFRISGDSLTEPVIFI